MTDEPDGLGEQLRFIEGLVAERATVAGDVLEIGADTWAIHGSIPIDGEVLMAEFARQEDAVAVLARLGDDAGLRGPTRR
jgi:hypothetical protein